MQSTYKDALYSILKKEQEISLESVHVIDESYRMIVFLQDLLSGMKKNVLDNNFTDENEEIEFFRIIKPQILGKLIYYNKIYRIETSCPVNSGKMYYKYFSSELQQLKNEYKEHICNSDFYRYYRSGRTDRDHDFFKLGKINLNTGLNSFIFEVDTQFSTYYDYKVSRIIADELLYNYLIIKINPVDKPDVILQNSESTKDVFWTESKNALIELIYALYASGAISNGKVGIRKISLVFQILFRIQLGDIHHAFHRMKDRPGNRTLFLDQLKSSLKHYMDKDL
ncbi:RteC domain-containing protein [Flavobacterium sp. Fl-318]|uniref:RteC domain-containing protein n=1 Tax=Flavobacterium cupriresistens TaxID=2893885 RepID=A0ABU4R5G8_9FLAO|nr:MULTISPECIES: RteC domain-containing protein [unclassified Flavobacterium]MDX6187835.1 RteC domain-containing protein [Flavobacterium sp. Fl-318]UFH42244.1 RteC domain-containing protein [Flavobacterium sp. F-323]